LPIIVERVLRPKELCFEDEPFRGDCGSEMVRDSGWPLLFVVVGNGGMGGIGGIGLAVGVVGVVGGWTCGSGVSELELVRRSEEKERDQALGAVVEDAAGDGVDFGSGTGGVVAVLAVLVVLAALLALLLLLPFAPTSLPAKAANEPSRKEEECRCEGGRDEDILEGVEES